MIQGMKKSLVLQVKILYTNGFDYVNTIENKTIFFTYGLIIAYIDR